MTNWTEYNEGLRRRGDLTVWISEETLGMWSAARRTTRGGQPRYSDLAIELCLTLGMVFKQPLRQTQGFMRGIAGILGVEGKWRTAGLSPHCEFQFLAARACSTKNAAVA